MRNSPAILQKGGHKHKRVPMRRTNGVHQETIGCSHRVNLGYSMIIIMIKITMSRDRNGA